MMIFVPGRAEVEKLENLEEICKKMFQFEEVEKDCFRPTSLFHARQTPSGIAFGGLIFSQALAVAEITVDEKYKPNSMHSYFVLAINSTLPLFYHVKRVRDGKSFANRTVEAIQNNKLCFMCQVSFHKPEPDSMTHKTIQMPKISGPEGFKPMREAVIQMQDLVNQGKIHLAPAMHHRLMVLDNKAYLLQNEPFEFRCCNLGNYYGFSSDLKPEMCFWIRAKGELSEDERFHRWLLALISDSTLIPSIMSPHFALGFQDSLHVSLDHSLWFHQSCTVRADEWLLLECRSRISSGARCLMEGRVWRRDGTLVASCQQEAIIRGKDGQMSKI